MHTLRIQSRILILFLFTLATALQADTILFRDGTRMNGRIIQQNQGSVVIVVGTRRQVVAKSRIARILYNDNYGNEEDAAAEEERKREEERRRAEEEQRRRAEELRRKQEEERRKQQELLEEIEKEKEEEKKREEDRVEKERQKEEERKDREERLKREETSRTQADDDSLWTLLFGEGRERHTLAVRLDGGGGRVRPLFPGAVSSVNYYRSLMDREAIWSSPVAYSDGSSYGGELEYIYNRFLVRLTSRRLESAYSESTYNLGTVTDPLTGGPTQRFRLSVDYARDLSRVEHSLGLGFSVYSNSFLEVRPVLEYMGQFTRSNMEGSTYDFQSSSLTALTRSETSNRMWLRGVRGGIEVLYDFEAFGQDFQWKIYGAAIQLKGSIVSDTLENRFNTQGFYQGSFTFRLDPTAFYEGSYFESVLFYQLMPNVRLYLGVAGQTGTATLGDADIAQNLDEGTPLQKYFQLERFNTEFGFGGLRDHHSRINVGAEYTLDL